MNKHRIQATFNQAVSSYDEAAALYREVGKRMLFRLGLVKFEPKTILDLGCNTGYFVAELISRYPEAHVIASDIAENMLKASRERGSASLAVGDAECLPFADGSIDLIFSNLVFQWCSLEHLFPEIKRVLSPEGVCVFSTYGPDTLLELQHAWSKVDEYAHVNAFTDMHHIGDIMLAAALRDPVVDRETLLLTYHTVLDLIREIKALGANTLLQKNTRKTLTGKQRFTAMHKVYEEHRGEDGLLPASYEIIYGLAWGAKPAPEGPQEIRIPISDIKKA